METVATLEAAAELAREHDEIDRLATLVSTLSAGPARRAMVLEACSRYAIHAEVEASHLLPAVCRYLPDGARTAAEETARHQALNRSIAAFLRLCEKPAAQDASRNAAEGAPPGADRADARSADEAFTELDEFDILIGQLVAGIQGHVEHQDTSLLPALNRVCPLAESRQLGARLHDALCAARRAQLGGEPRPRRHGIRALLHCVAHGLSTRTGQPAGTS